MSKPMGSNTDDKLALISDAFGLIGCVGKVYDNKELSGIATHTSYISKQIVYSLPTSSNVIEQASILNQIGISIFSLDFPNAHSEASKNLILEMRSRFPNAKLIVGNALTVESYSFLSRCGADAVKIGNGNLSDEMKTMFNIDLSKLILSCSKLGLAQIIVDHSITSPSDFVKSIALGADIVALSFHGVEETGGSLVYAGDTPYRSFSYKTQFEPNYKTKLVKAKGSLQNELKTYSVALIESMAFTNCNNLYEFKGSIDQ